MHSVEGMRRQAAGVIAKGGVRGGSASDACSSRDAEVATIRRFFAAGLRPLRSANVDVIHVVLTGAVDAANA
jgi:hypothetical protein